MGVRVPQPQRSQEGVAFALGFDRGEEECAEQKGWRESSTNTMVLMVQ